MNTVTLNTGDGSTVVITTPDGSALSLVLPPKPAVTLSQVWDALQTLIERFNTMSQTLNDRITALLAAVANETTVNQSAVALINGLVATVQQVRSDLAKTNDISAALSQLDQATNSITQNAAGLAGAVTTGTAAENEGATTAAAGATTDPSAAPAGTGTAL